MPSELKGVVLERSGNSCTVFLENHVSKTADMLPHAENGCLVWVSYDYVHQKIIGLRIRNKFYKENYYEYNRKPEPERCTCNWS